LLANSLKVILNVRAKVQLNPKVEAKAKAEN
jgi:hypothetical protein